MQDLSIYIHWPFCRSKCPYCDFMSVPEHDTDTYQNIERLLLIDLQNSLNDIDDAVCIKTVFFGGGTPSLMSPKSIERIIEFLVKNYKTDEQIEISLEANPATFSTQKLLEIKKSGINRLSLGVQSFKDRNLKFLGRIYDAKQAFKSAEAVANIFDNYSFDFMYGYQLQSLNDLEDDLLVAVDNYKCPHVSCYQLTFEEGTPFFTLLHNKEIFPISEKLEIEMYKHIRKFLQQFALERYEISNYALKHFESKHNLSYWRYKNYLGVGPSAHSRLILNNQKHELKKISDIHKWVEKVSHNDLAYDVRNALSPLEQLEEMFIMGLRLQEGISLYNVNSIDIEESLKKKLLSKIEYLSQIDLLVNTGSFIELTSEGLLKQNSIINYLFAS